MTLAGGHRADDGRDAVEVTVVDGVDLVAHLPHAGHHAEQVFDRPHLLDHHHLLEEVLEREVFARRELAGHLGGLLLVERLLGLLDQGEDVTHVEDARGHPVGVEGVEVFELLARGGEHDRPAGDVADRQGGAAAGVAVELGQHDAVEADALHERLRRRDGVLADHGVDHEQDLVGRDRVADVGGLLHHLLVDAQAAGGVDDDDVVLQAAGLVDGAAGHLDRVADAAARLGRVDGDLGALAHDLELLDGVGPLEVGGDQHGRVALLAQPPGELAREGCLARALEARQHDDGGRGLGEAEPAGLTAEDPDQLVIDDLDDLLRRIQRLGDLGTAGALLDLGDERLDHRQRDIGL